MTKARGAYGDSVAKDLAAAVEDLRTRPHRLDRCMEAMGMTLVSKAALLRADQDARALMAGEVRSGVP